MLIVLPIPLGVVPEQRPNSMPFALPNDTTQRSREFPYSELIITHPPYGSSGDEEYISQRRGTRPFDLLKNHEGSGTNRLGPGSDKP